MVAVDLQLSRRTLAIFQFLLEGYDGLATVTTIDPDAARVRIAMAPEFKEEVCIIIEEIGKEIAGAHRD